VLCNWRCTNETPVAYATFSVNQNMVAITQTKHTNILIQAVLAGVLHLPNKPAGHVVLLVAHLRLRATAASEREHAPDDATQRQRRRFHALVRQHQRIHFGKRWCA